MKPTDFDYELPTELIAQVPATQRDAARLLVCERELDRVTHASVSDLERWLRPGDLIVVNDTRVLPARVDARRTSGGRVEVLLVEPLAGAEFAWAAWLSPARRLSVGEVLAAPEAWGLELGERRLRGDGSLAPEWAVTFLDERGEPANLERGAAWLERAGHVPLPPYIEREDGAADRERYQTVYAREPGAIAAPTAGLHLTRELLERLDARGVERAAVTLHVGPGTFRPVQVEDLAQHEMHSERFELPASTVRAVEACRRRGGRVIAIGTTTVRALETCAAGGRLEARSGRTDLFITPGHEFRAVDGLLTNFHLPRSTLLMMVSAFAGRERTLRLYAEAVERRYRFYSYGDAMLLL